MKIRLTFPVFAIKYKGIRRIKAKNIISTMIEARLPTVSSAKPADTGEVKGAAAEAHVLCLEERCAGSPDNIRRTVTFMWSAVMLSVEPAYSRDCVMAVFF